MLSRVEAAIGEAYSLPLEACVAETEGELGYVLQVTLYNLFAAAACTRPLATLLTHVVVDEHDPAFQRPSKPIGPFLSALRAQELQRRGMTVTEDAGRGWRRVVPSPSPREIIESHVIDQLLDMGSVVIAAGGGGIPVVRQDGQLKGVEAVVDKDLASAVLGRQLEAQRMIILTSVPCAYRYFGTRAQEPIGAIDVEQAQGLIEEGHFAPGSMLPKMQAALAFAQRPGAEAVICDPRSLPAALAGQAGTMIRQGR
jgi:carbamate kinase